MKMVRNSIRDRADRAPLYIKIYVDLLIILMEEGNDGIESPLVDVGPNGFVFDPWTDDDLVRMGIIKDFSAE
jgi:hypothetical protein